MSHLHEELAQRVAAGELGDPQEVVDALVEEVESTWSGRPLRHPVGADVSAPVSAINETCHETQDQLLREFGLK